MTTEKTHDALDIKDVTSNEKPQAVASSHQAHQEDESKLTPYSPQPSSSPPTTYLSGPPLYLVSLSLSLTVFLLGLDQSILATAIPSITTEFSSLSDVGWYGSAYLLTSTALQPTFGKIYSIFNIKWTFVFSAGLFEVGSIVCALANGSGMLIVGRAIAGVGSASLFSGALTILGGVVRLERRSLHIAVLSGMFGVSRVLGPILGGVLVSRVSWRWCFWINLPLGGAAIVMILMFLRQPGRVEEEATRRSVKQRIHEIDFTGSALLIGAVVSLLLALQWGGIVYSWSDSRVWGCLLGFGLIGTLFVASQIQLGDRATIPIRILKKRSITAAALTLAFLTMGVYCHLYYLPFYFQAVQGVTAEQSGIRYIAYPVSNTVGALVSGYLVTLAGYYTPFIWIGTAIFTVGAGLLSTLQKDSTPGAWIGYQTLAGLGSGASTQLPFMAVQVVLDNKDLPTGNALVIFFESLGGALAVSIAQNVFANTLVNRLKGVEPTLKVGNSMDLGSGFHPDLGSSDTSPSVSDAYGKAIAAAFLFATAAGGLAFVSGFLFEWKTVKADPPTEDADAMKEDRS